MTKGLNKKTNGLGGIILGHWDNNLNHVSIGFRNKKSNRITMKRWRAKVKRMWKKEELNDWYQ